LRIPVRQVARPLPGLQRLGHAGGGGGAGRGPAPGVGRLGRREPPGEAGGRGGRGRGAPAHRHRRAGPRARWRRGARLAGAARWRSPHRPLQPAPLPRQAKMRAARLGVRSPAVHLFAETDAEKVLAAAESLRPVALVVDSIQTMFLTELGSAPGTLSQVRGVAGRLMSHAKRSGVPTFLVGHVTKDGSIAGPRVLEHMVDTVLYFEGERGHPFRILRAHKNRFGSTNEIGVFEMKGAGLAEVADPSALFLAERPVGKSGSVVTSTLNGTRPILVEVQALVAPTGYGIARGTGVGGGGER